MLTGQEVASLPPLPQGCSALAVSPDGTRFAVSLWDNTGRLYDARSAELIAVLPGFDHWADGMAFTPDSAELIAEVRAGRLRRWRARDGSRLDDSTVSGHAFRSIEFSPEGRLLTSEQAGLAVLWDPATGRKVHEFRGHGGPLRGAAFLPDGSRIITTGYDGTVRFWERQPEMKWRYSGSRGCSRRC